MRKILLSFVFVLLVPAVAEARPGALDPTFGHAGRIIRSAGFGDRSWRVVRTQIVGLPDGRFVLLTRNSLYGFFADGTIARAFGAGEGPVPTPPGYELEVTGLAADATGRVVVAGTLRAPDGAERAMVARYTTTGDLDAGFGEGGIVTTDFGLPGREDAGDGSSSIQVQVAGVAVDSQGRVVLTGTRTRSVGPCRASSNLVYADAFAARLDLSGALDPGFGDGGVARMHDIAKVGKPVLDAEDDVYVTTPYGGRGPCTEPRYDQLVGRLNAAGRPDSRFGGDGWISLHFPRRAATIASALGPNGSLLLVENRWTKDLARKVVEVKRLLPDGALDDRFGRNGVATLSAPRTLEAAAATVDPAGRTLVTGTAARLRNPKKRRLFLGRLTPAGRPDRGFGRGGLTTTGWGRRAEAVGSNLLLQPHRVLVTGTARSSIFGSGSGLVLAGYRLGG